jgi:hypothetical protein
MTRDQNIVLDASQRQPLNLVWRRESLDFVLEGYFIKQVLLGALKRPVRQIMFEDKLGCNVDHNTLFVVLRGDTANLLRAARQNGLKNLGVLHLADEGGVDDRSFYAHADYVLRHYWFEGIVAPAASPPVLWVPNGYRTGVGPIEPSQTLPIECRHIPGFFAGSFHEHSPNHERQEMLRTVEEAKLPFLLFGTQKFGIGMSPSAYAGFLGTAKFALAPGGLSPETIRLYDALEHGAIPILVHAPFIDSKDALGALGPPPLVTIDRWNSLPTVYRDLMQLPPTRLEDRRRDLLDWWTRFKQHCQNRVRDVIEAAFLK